MQPSPWVLCCKLAGKPIFWCLVSISEDRWLELSCGLWWPSLFLLLFILFLWVFGCITCFKMWAHVCISSCLVPLSLLVNIATLSFFKKKNLETDSCRIAQAILEFFVERRLALNLCQSSDPSLLNTAIISVNAPLKNCFYKFIFITTVKHFWLYSITKKISWFWLVIEEVASGDDLLLEVSTTE